MLNLSIYISYENARPITSTKPTEGEEENVIASISDINGSRMSLLGSDIDESNVPQEMSKSNTSSVSNVNENDDEPIRSNISSKKPSMANLESEMEGEPLPPQPEAN